MILASGARGPGFNSRNSPCHASTRPQTTHTRAHAPPHARSHTDPNVDTRAHTHRRTRRSRQKRTQTHMHEHKHTHAQTCEKSHAKRCRMSFFIRMRLDYRIRAPYDCRLAGRLCRMWAAVCGRARACRRMRVRACVILIGVCADRHREDSNPCGQSPMDFESIALTARTQCHVQTFLL